jgi:hypothetical protein
LLIPFSKFWPIRPILPSGGLPDPAWGSGVALAVWIDLHSTSDPQPEQEAG